MSAGRAQLQSANGTIQVDSARSHVTAKTAFGDVRLGALSQGTTEAETAYGQIEIGVLDGVAAWLDLSTSFGRVNNELEDTGRPSADEQTTQIPRTRPWATSTSVGCRLVPKRGRGHEGISRGYDRLEKSFGQKRVLDGIDLEIQTGSVFALLGPNGAGKTTMVRIMSTLIAADSGQVRVAGDDVLADPDSVREAIGVTGQFSAVDEL